MENEYIKKITLDHQLEEWKLLNDYVNKMDLGYQQSITIVISIFAIIATVLSKDTNSKWEWGVFIIPLGLIAFFAYVSYQFRITAILRGHLAALEESMNKKMCESVHMWNSVLVETFMAHNNSINKIMMIPIVGFLMLLIGYCLIITWNLLILSENRIEFGTIYFIFYWFIVIIFFLIVFIPFLKNEDVRYETYNEKKVYNKYIEYKILKDRKKDFTYELLKKENNMDKKILRDSIIIFWLIFAIGFGILNLFWLNYPNYNKLRGLYDYYAATIGDAFFIPCLISSGYYFCNINKWKEYSKNSIETNKKVFIFGCGSVVIAIFIQASWIISNVTELNWTIDRIHHFNAAGWYHAIYFVSMFGIITRVFVKSLIINKQERILGKKSYVLMWVSALGYLYMHMIDDWLNQENYLLFIIICTGIIMILYYLGMGNNKDLMYIFYIISITMAMLLYCFCKFGGLKMNVLQIVESTINLLR